jgi:hypothetical protein
MRRARPAERGPRHGICRGTHMRYRRHAVLNLALSLRVVLVAAVFAAVLGISASAFARTFDPELVLSDATMRDYQSMSASQIQAFLKKRPGPLKRMSFARHDNGSSTTASVIIWEASQAWHINPRVLLALLQKEQSLLTRRHLAAHTLQRAVGAGCPDRVTNKYPGFGNQMWNGARMLDGYGEGKTTLYVPYPWKPGMKNKFTGGVRPKNLATYKVYVYNPSIGAKKPYGDLSRQSCSGNSNLWKIYWHYFGNPLGTPKTTPLPSGITAASIALATSGSRRPCSVVTTLTGTLVSASSLTTVAGQSVYLQGVKGNGWATIAGTAQTVGANGAFAFRLTNQRLLRFRVRFAGGGGLSAAVSGAFVSDVGAVLGKLRVTRTASTAVATGTVAPSFVKTRLTLQNRHGGRWRTYKTVSATSKGGAWRVSVKLPRGSWRARAAVNDSRVAPATSGWKYF